MTTKGKPAMVAMCPHGCAWTPDHDSQGRCFNDCGRCPDGPCKGFETPTINQFQFQRRLLKER